MDDESDGAMHENESVQRYDWASLMSSKCNSWTILLLSLALLCADYWSGPMIQFPILFVAPVAWAAWNANKRLAYILSGLLPLIRFAFFVSWHEANKIQYGLINALIRSLTLAVVVFFVDRAREVFALRKQLKTLQGILPICASCKKIRTDKGKYVQMESYISEHSEARFSHGICPECAKRLYPDLDLTGVFHDAEGGHKNKNEQEQ
jgi:hypothetical protein